MKGPLYNRRTIEIYPGSLRERSLERMESDNPTESAIIDDMTLGGPLVEVFVDPGYELTEFRRGRGKIFGVIRQKVAMQSRLKIPVPARELEEIGVLAGYYRLHVRLAIREAWRMGKTRRFIRSLVRRGLVGKTGKSAGVHYILERRKNEPAAITGRE